MIRIDEVEPANRAIVAEIYRRGLTLEFTGNSWRINGPGVSIVVSALRYLNVHDLEIARPRPTLEHTRGDRAPFTGSAWC